MNKKRIIIGLFFAITLGGGLLFLYTDPANDKGDATTAHEVKGPEQEVGTDRENGESINIVMTPEKQKENGVVVAVAKREPLVAVIGATGKVEVNGDRIAHVSPCIAGKIVSVNASLGESVASGEVLLTLDSVELGEAMNRYHQSKTRLALAKNNLDRIATLVEKKIAARKDILQAETDYQMTLTELHTDEERLSLYGLTPEELASPAHKKQLLTLRSPIGGTITEKHAIIGELADPSNSLYTVADLSTVWVLVDIHEKDLAKAHKGQAATVIVGAFPDLKFRGRITYIADLVDEATRTVKARVEVANPGRKLKPEMFASVELTLPGTSTTLAVSEEALQEIDGKKVLFVTDDKGEEFVPRNVEPGRTVGGMVEILSGLQEGERYAVKGAFILKSELKKGELEE